LTTQSEQEAYDEAVKYGHNTKKSTLDLLMNISSIKERFILKNLPVESLKDPKYQNLATQLKQGTSGSEIDTAGNFSEKIWEWK
jgi:hypothetical protein